MRSPSGAAESAAFGPSTVTTAKATARYSKPTTASAAAVARGRSRAGRRNSAARCVIASQPAKLHTSRAAAGASENQPCGAKGVRLLQCACGRANATARRSRSASSPASASCTRPVTRRPAAFVAVTTAISAAAVIVAVAVPPPRAASTYWPANRAAGAAPVGTVKKKHQPTTTAVRSPKARRA